MAKKRAPLSLVTGACGFMGTHMVEVLAEAGHKIRATDLPRACEKDNLKVGLFPGVLRKLGVEPTPADVTKKETLETLVDGVDYVFHIAAVFNYSAPMSVLETVNVQGTRNLCDLLLARNSKRLKRLVLWGAGGVYGFVPREQLPLKESMPANPPNNYLKSKSMQENLVMELGRTRGLPYSIMRPTTVYGPRAVYGGGQLVRAFANMNPVMVPANFDFHIPFVHVQDVCRAALHLAQVPEANGQIFNLNDDTVMTNVEYGRYMAQLMGHVFLKLPPVPIQPIRSAMIQFARAAQFVSREITHKPPVLEADSAAYFGAEITFSNEKLKSTGYRFVYPNARQGLRDTVAWYRAQGWL